MGPGSQVVLSIAEIGYELWAHDKDITLALDPNYVPFVNGCNADISLCVYSGSMAEVDLGPVLFDSGGVWTLHASRGELVYGFVPGETSPQGGRTYSTLMRLDQDLTRGSIYVKAPANESSLRVRALSQASGEVLTVAMLSRGRGVELHGLGLRSQDTGYLFCGVSGAGKSTVARIWRDEPELEILSDDRIIVRKADGGLRIYGTPWHGDAGAASPGSAPLQQLFFLRQGSTNHVRALSPGEAAGRLMTCCFATFWDPVGMAFTLSVLEEISTAVPCYELTFVKDHSMVDFVRQL